MGQQQKMLEIDCVLDKIEEGTVKEILILHSSCEQYGFRFEIPVTILEQVNASDLSSGSKIKILLSTEKTDMDPWDIYLVGVPYQRKKTDEESTLYLSFGGFQARLVTTQELPEFRFMEKIYLGIKIVK